MLKESEAYSGFAVNDTDRAKRFYGEVLGLAVTEINAEYGMLSIGIKGSRDVFVYTKPDHQPATFTILNFPVPDVEAAVDDLTAKGVEFLRYDGFNQDERGISRGMGPDIAWFTDPAGNVLSIHATD
jgi:predicted enzyme related to lactoylglutathione lyase